MFTHDDNTLLSCQKQIQKGQTTWVIDVQWEGVVAFILQLMFTHDDTLHWVPETDSENIVKKLKNVTKKKAIFSLLSTQ